MDALVNYRHCQRIPCLPLRWAVLLLAIALSACGTTPLHPVTEPVAENESAAVADTQPKIALSNQPLTVQFPAATIASPTYHSVSEEAGRNTHSSKGEPTPASTGIGADSKPTTPNDLWQRIRSGLRLQGADNPTIERELRQYIAQPRNLHRLLERARPYLFFIVEQVENWGLPTEIALLPAVESSFRPFAYSPEHAVGLWQFIPTTGQRFGLKRDWWYDGRRDLLASTNAALNYLQTLQRRFDGDWELALAAYNAGEGSVGKALRYNRRNNQDTDFWSLQLPKETRVYVPRLLALSRIIATPERYGITLKPFPAHPHFVAVDIDSQLDLTLAAELAEIPIDQLNRLNPGFNRWATAPGGPHRLLLPSDKAKRFSTRLAKLKPEQRMRWLRYRIKPGDSLSVIAQRHGISVSHLMQANQLRNSRIRAERMLFIPTLATGDKLSPPAGLLTKHPAKKKRKGPISYTVRPGDTLWEIGRNHRVSYLKLAKWNGLAPDETLHPKQRLLIWKR